MKRWFARNGRGAVIVAVLIPSLMLTGAAAPSADAALSADASARATTLDCPPDEAGGSFATAAEIYTGNTYAYICPEGDEDYFKFWVISGQEITIVMDDMPKPYDLVLYDPDQGERYSESGPEPVTRHITYSDPYTASGYWYALVYGGDPGEWNATVHYELALTLTPSPLLELTKTLVDPLEDVATLGQTVEFEIVLHNGVTPVWATRMRSQSRTTWTWSGIWPSGTIWDRSSPTRAGP